MDNALSVLITALLVGMATYGLSGMIVYEDGPKRIIKRFKWGLLPRKGMPQKTTLDSPAVMEDPGKRITAGAKMKAEIETWEQTWEADSWFAQTWAGAVYLVLACVFCLGLWASGGFAVVAWLSGLILLKHVLIVWLAGYGIHSFLNYVGYKG